MDVEQTKRLLTWALGFVLLGGLILSVGMALFRGRQLWHFQTCTVTPWSIGEVLLAIIVLVAVPASLLHLVRYAGFFRRYYGVELDLTDKLAVFRADSWIALSAPMTVAAILMLMRWISRTQPWQIGFTSERTMDRLALGYLTWLLFSPAVLAVHFGVLFAYQRLIGSEPDFHPLQKLLSQDANSTEWFLLVLKAVVWAPLLEELLFRGVILPWATRTWWGGLACAGAALVLVLLPSNLGTGPIVLAALIGAVLLLSLRRKPAEQSIWANVGVSLLFAAVHSAVWPTPIPLFILSLGLGWLQQRTQSLWGPIVMHGLFNGFSTLLLLAGIYSR